MSSVVSMTPDFGKVLSVDRKWSYFYPPVLLGVRTIDKRVKGVLVNDKAIAKFVFKQYYIIYILNIGGYAIVISRPKHNLIRRVFENMEIIKRS